MLGVLQLKMSNNVTNPEAGNDNMKLLTMNLILLNGDLIINDKILIKINSLEKSI